MYDQESWVCDINMTGETETSDWEQEEAQFTKQEKWMKGEREQTRMVLQLEAFSWKHRRNSYCMKQAKSLQKKSKWRLWC